MKSATAFGLIDQRASNAMAMQLLTDPYLRQQVRNTGKLGIRRLRQSVDDAISTAYTTSTPPAVDSFAVPQQLLKGLPGEAMFIAFAMAFDTFREGQAFFGLSAKSTRQRIGKHLDAVEGEKALRLIHAVLLATHVLGSADEARAYLKSPNIALGGMTPRNLLMTAEGGLLVLHELQTHNAGGPI